MNLFIFYFSPHDVPPFRSFSAALWHQVQSESLVRFLHYHQLWWSDPLKGRKLARMVRTKIGKKVSSLVTLVTKIVFNHKYIEKSLTRTSLGELPFWNTAFKSRISFRHPSRFNWNLSTLILMIQDYKRTRKKFLKARKEPAKNSTRRNF